MDTNKNQNTFEKNLLTQEEFDMLFDDNVSVKKQKQLQEKVGNRFVYIMHEMTQILDRELIWFDFDNEGGERRPGYFDSDKYKNEIRFVGDMHNKTKFFEYENSFPTTWLKEDFEDALKLEYQDFLAEKKQNEKKEIEDRKAFKNLVNEVKEKIFEKLTDEEKCFINFASENDIKSRLKNLEKAQHKAKKGKSKIKP